MYLPIKMYKDIVNSKEYKKTDLPTGCAIQSTKLVCKELNKLDDGKRREIEFYEETIKNLEDEKAKTPLTEYNNLISVAIRNLCEWWKYKKCYYIDPILQQDFIRGELPEVSFEIIKRMPCDVIYLELPEHDFHGILVNKLLINDEESGLKAGLHCSILNKDESIRTFNIPFKSNVIVDYEDIFRGSSDFHWMRYRHKDNKLELYTSFCDGKLLQQLLKTNNKDIFQIYAENEYKPLIQLILNSLLYICSKEPDISTREKLELREYDVTKKRTVKTEVEKKELAVKYVRRRKKEEASYKKNPTGRKINYSYWRKAHWHLYWTGTGRTIPAVKWIEPVLCGTGKSQNNINVEVIKNHK